MVRRKPILIMCLFLTAATLSAFWRVARCEFTNFDDPRYVTENSYIQDGVTMNGIGWAFTTGYAANWHPLTWVSHMLDVQLFGLDPHWHHLVNLLFHVATTIMLFLVLQRMTDGLWQSAFVAGLFALHPLHVESVAWVAERKDVLCAFFWMLAMGAYVFYVERPGIGRRLAVLVCFVLGLMAKPMLVTLPFVLLLLDYWPLKRMMEPAARDKGKRASKHTATDQPVSYQWAVIRPLLLEKIPLFALAAVSSVITYIVQRQGGAVRSVEAFPLTDRLGNAFVSYMMYMGKMLWPMKLAVLYPHPGSWPAWEVIGAVLLLIAVTSTVVWKAEKYPYLAVGWFWYAGTLVPVIGIVQVGGQAMADRYTYIPLIGLFIMVAWGMPEVVKEWRYGKEALGVSSALVLACLFMATWVQVGYWRSSITLYDHTLEVNDHDSFIHNSRGVAYDGLGSYKQAIADYDKAIEIDPSYADAYNNRGISYGRLGDYTRAIEEFDRAIRIDPGYAEAYNNRGVVYNGLGNYRQAIEDYGKAIEIDPRYAEAYSDRGIGYGSLGNQTRAIEDFDRAIEINPRSAEAFRNRGTAYYKLGKYQQAVGDYDRAIRIKPKYPEAYNNRGVAYNGLGNYRQAIVDFDRTVEIDPGCAEAFYNRGFVYFKLGDRTKAIEDMKTAARLGDQNARNFMRGQGITR